MLLSFALLFAFSISAFAQSRDRDRGGRRDHHEGAGDAQEEAVFGGPGGPNIGSAPGPSRASVLQGMIAKNDAIIARAYRKLEVTSDRHTQFHLRDLIASKRSENADLQGALDAQ
jgi:hypothetical protein